MTTKLHLAELMRDLRDAMQIALHAGHFEAANELGDELKNLDMLLSSKQYVYS